MYCGVLWYTVVYCDTNTHLISTTPGVHVLKKAEVCSVLPSILCGLHLTVDNPSVLPLPCHMVDLCQKGCILEGDKNWYTTKVWSMYEYQALFPLTVRVG